MVIQQNNFSQRKSSQSFCHNTHKKGYHWLHIKWFISWCLWKPRGANFIDCWCFVLFCSVSDNNSDHLEPLPVLLPTLTIFFWLISLRLLHCWKVSITNDSVMLRNSQYCRFILYSFIKISVLAREERSETVGWTCPLCSGNSCNLDVRGKNRSHSGFKFGCFIFDRLLKCYWPRFPYMEKRTKALSLIRHCV